MRHETFVALAGLALLTACGGSGNGGVASAPAPVAPAPAPSQSPSPPPAQVLKPEVIALQSDKPFVTLGLTETDTLSSERIRNLSGSKDNEHFVASSAGRQDESVDFRYDQATGTYSITLPDSTGGNLSLKGLNGSAGEFASSTGHSVIGPNGELGVFLTMPTPFTPDFKYTYSHWGYWNKTVENADGTARATYGLFAYGIPAAAIPRTGTARYTGDIVANSPRDFDFVTGTFALNFDFAASRLDGSIHPVFFTNGFYPSLDHDYGTYDFAQTVYAAGSNRYSGVLAKNGVPLADSWFAGLLTGTGAEETIGRFVAPFVRDGTSGALSGIWIGKRD